MTVPEGVVWAIFLLPVASLVITGLVTKPYPRISGYVTIVAIATSWVFAFWTLGAVIHTGGEPLHFGQHQWLNITSGGNPVIQSLGGPDLRISVGLRIDGLSAMMLVVVTSISLFVQIYSQGYMEGDGGYSRYFSYMSLFTAAMLGLVIVNSIIFVYMFWELVGLTSYLLIGFWFNKPTASNAANKAFWTTRFGDVGFLVGILLIWSRTHTFDIRAWRDTP